jgi:CRISPR-associated protein Csm5
MNFQNIRTTFHCEIQILTPVHIGNGEKFINNFDFLCEGNKGRVFDHKRLFAIVEQLGGNDITSFTAAIEDGQLANWLRNNNVNINEAVVHSFNWPGHNAPRDINRQIRDGLGHPIIPGSSLKGVFRTAILAQLVDNDQTNPVYKVLENLKKQKDVNLKFADSTLCSNLLGKNANVNLMRSLTVADFTFTPLDVQIQAANVTRLTCDTSFVRKHWNIWMEKLNRGATATGQISFDDFLIAQANGKESFNFKADLTLTWLIEALRKRTDNTIDSELNFLRNKNGDSIDDMRIFYTKLKQDHQGLQDNEAIVQFAWGSGWKGMTGELIVPELLTYEVREKLRLAPKYLQFPFPKSRRVAVTGDAALPMGWIRLKFTSKEEIRRAEAIKVQEDKQALQIKLNQEQQQKEEQEVWGRMSELERCVAIIRGDEIASSQATGQDPVSSCWKKLETGLPEDQKVLAQAFRDMWINDPKTWTRNQCTPAQWEKVKLIKAILEPMQKETELSSEDQAAIEKVKAITNWSKDLLTSLNAAKLPLAALKALQERMKNEWDCAENRAKPDKKQAWRQIKQLIQQAQKTGYI